MTSGEFTEASAQNERGAGSGEERGLESRLALIGLCSLAVVVRRPGNQKALLASESPTASRKAGSVLLARLPLERIPVTGFWRNAHTLASGSIRPACASLIGEEQIVSRLRRQRGTRP